MTNYEEYERNPTPSTARTVYGNPAQGYAAPPGSRADSGRDGGRREARGAAEEVHRGHVRGTPELADYIYQSRAIKPIAAIPIHWGKVVGTRKDVEIFQKNCKMIVKVMG